MKPKRLHNTHDRRFSFDCLFSFPSSNKLRHYFHIMDEKQSLSEAINVRAIGIVTLVLLSHSNMMLNQIKEGKIMICLHTFTKQGCS